MSNTVCVLYIVLYGVTYTECTLPVSCGVGETCKLTAGTLGDRRPLLQRMRPSVEVLESAIQKASETNTAGLQVAEVSQKCKLSLLNLLSYLLSLLLSDH